MKFKSVTCFSFLPLCLIVAFANAQSLSISDSIDIFVKSQMQQRHIPALQVAVVRNGAIVKNTTYGVANLEYDIKATDQTIFSINSITKAFVGVAIMQLAEENKLNCRSAVALSG